MCFHQPPPHPRRLPHQLNYVFLTSSHQRSKAVGFILHIKAHYSFVSLLKSTSALRLWDFFFLFYRLESKLSMSPETIQSQTVPLLSLQRSGIVSCLPFISSSFFFLTCHCTLFWTPYVSNLMAAPCNFTHTVTEPCVVTEGLKVYLPCALYKIMF